MEDEILTIEEAAKLLKVSPEIVADLLKSSDLVGRTIGGQWRTTKRALLSFVDGAPLAMSCCPPEMCCSPGSPAADGSGSRRGCCC
ncbi:MAG: helix-turn-helix domain-containing protein [Candidatus Hydrogenedentes bacterium]|nr:helix-turn-helix domain-containing protein [Candidatus Hydrogenedentota bacterium]